MVGRLPMVVDMPMPRPEPNNSNHLARDPTESSSLFLYYERVRIFFRAKQQRERRSWMSTRFGTGEMHEVKSGVKGPLMAEHKHRCGCRGGVFSMDGISGFSLKLQIYLGQVILQPGHGTVKFCRFQGVQV
ncbi:hypothetical protein F2P56_015842 [Juglans regia]|uniref:Uncharacterized protein LOC109021696 n=2 Tax=Juglans regia TaxID=51240 RepID=A0A2I4HUY2_JUGRE|nr:uncharacterized protein LOC109021696 [Juglans regia]KAF5465876.1 hypothetical protein F2P56_015842 [Juglans regia]